MNFFQYLIQVFFGNRKPRHTEYGNLKSKSQMTMKELISKIHLAFDQLNDDLGKYEQGNKTAGRRARKTSVELEKLFKEFRKRSINEMP